MAFAACNRGNKIPITYHGVDTTGGLIQPGPGVTLKRHYSSYNDFISYIRGNSIEISPVKLNDSVLKSPDTNTVVHYFEFKGVKFKYTSIFLRQETDEDEAGDSLYTWNFRANNQNLNLKARSVPDSVRGADFSSVKLPDLELELDKAGTFEWHNATYLVIPSTVSSCQGGFCQTELDHIFKLKDSITTYFTVDGWQICDLNHDQQIEQILFCDDPIIQRHYIDELKKRHTNGASNIDPTKCFTIQIWAFKHINNEQWEPMTDKNGKPYFILMSYQIAASPNTYKVLDYNWIKEL